MGDDACFLHSHHQYSWHYHPTGFQTCLPFFTVLTNNHLNNEMMTEIKREINIQKLIQNV